jgi:formylglycine-generating enzyme required for sulfatase activity
MERKWGLIVALGVAFFGGVEPALAQLSMDWVEVGDPGNACDPGPQGCFGAVSYGYEIGTYEVTNAQYAEFLNAVAVTDLHDLYDPVMGTGPPVYLGGITRSGSQGSYTYTPIPGREDVPVIRASFWRAVRFANWLHNGMPVGAQGPATTEDGAYTLDATSIANNTVVRNPGAKAFLPSLDEWYKAAYYDAGSMIYHDYPAASDTQIICAPPGISSNTANCESAVGQMVEVGSYPNAPGPNGTFDQGGNMFEWCESIPASPSLADWRVVMGGDWSSFAEDLAAGDGGASLPSQADIYFGFRVARPSPVPEGVPVISWIGRTLLAAALLGFGGYRRGRSWRG